MDLNKKVLGFPLYHGTSSLFLDSITELGLGGQNICEKYRIIEIFTQVVDVFKKKHMNTDWWVMEGFICEKMIGSEVTNGGFNFRYGGVYLTPSLETAQRYSKSNKYGSELVSYFIRSYEELYKHDSSLADKIFPLNHPLREVIVSGATPVVLEINGLSKNDLTTEQGEPIDAQLKLMDEVPKAIWQQFNFECLNIIPSRNIKLLELNG